MRELIISAVILLFILWIIVGISKRQIRGALRALAMNRRGIYRSGGLLGRPSVEIPNGGARTLVLLHNVRWFGGGAVAVFQAPWLPPRPNLPRTELRTTTLNLPVVPGQTSSPEISPDLRGAISRWQQFGHTGDHLLYAQQHAFIAQSSLSVIAPPQIVHWFDLTLRVYNLLAAETEAGIRFEAASAPAGEACCQVCGVALEADQMVCCPTCGAPHHADCWEYNRGCAIYGCRSGSLQQ